MAYQNDPQKVLIPECRLSYVNLVTPRASLQGGDEKYSATLLIPKSATTVKADIDQSIEAAAKDAVNRIWGGKRPPELRSVVHDGDGVRPSGELSAKNARALGAYSKHQSKASSCRKRQPHR